MADQTEISIPKTRINERSGFTATARFRTRATAAASIPTTVHYMLYNLTTREIIKDWTSVTPAAEVSITIDAQLNKIQDETNSYERIEMLVAADKGLSTQSVDTAFYRIRNVGGISNG